MITYNHWDIEYQGGGKAVSDTVIAESVRRVRRRTEQMIAERGIQIVIPKEYANSELAKKLYTEGYIDGFSALVAVFN